MPIKIPGPKKTTPPNHDESQDPNKQGHKHNYFLWQTRSGHVPLRVDDTKGNESISMEHRTGSKISFLPDGSTKFVSNYGRVDITYGQQRSRVTGAQDTTIDGMRSVRVKLTNRETNEGDYEQTTVGKHMTMAQSYNIAAAEHFHLAADEMTVKADSAVTVESGKGPVTVTGKGSVGLVSQQGSVGLSSESGSVGIKGAKDIAVQGNAVHITGGGATIKMEDGKVYINSGAVTTASETQPWTGTIST